MPPASPFPRLALTARKRHSTRRLSGAADCFTATTEDIWADGDTGLIARDIAMNVALPEVDGRVLSRAVAFKSEAQFDEDTQTAVVKHLPAPDRIDFAADLATAWVKLSSTPAADRRIAVVLANYPNRDGRIGNGVGLDTPAGTMTLLRAMQDARDTTSRSRRMTATRSLNGCSMGPPMPGLKRAGLRR